MSELDFKVKRPALLWLTQTVLVLFLGVMLLTMGAMLLTIPGTVSSGQSLLGTLLALLLYAAVAGPLALLFHGLAHRRRWAWGGSIGFATFLLILLIASRVILSRGPFPEHADALSGRARPGPGQFSIPVLLSIYVLALYWSPKVRAFLGVPQRDQYRSE